MRRFLALVAFTGILLGLTAASAHASGNCPEGSSFNPTAHGSGGVCIDHDTDEVVKKLRPRRLLVG